MKKKRMKKELTLKIWRQRGRVWREEINKLNKKLVLPARAVTQHEKLWPMPEVHILMKTLQQGVMGAQIQAFLF